MSQNRVQFLSAKWFAQIPVHARLQALFAFAGQRVRRESNDAGTILRTPPPMNFPARFPTVQLRHLHIEQEHVVVAALKSLQHLAPVYGKIGLVAGIQQDQSSNLPINLVIVRQQDAQGFQSRLGACFGRGRLL